MSPSNSKLLHNCESICIQNNNGKRSFFKTLENDVTDYSIYNKRKKPIKHSEADINNAVLAASGGYMTRNRLSKQLTNNSELEEASITEDKCSKTDNLRNKSESAKKNKKSARKISQNKLQLGYVFTHDISLSYPGKQLSTEYKKSTPSLFESDSDPEIEDFQINYDEVKNISTCISNPDIISSAFDKNVEMKTYFNKKSYTFNNKSNIKSLNTFEKSNQESSKLSNNVKLNHDSNLYKSISPNSSKTNKPLTVTDSKTSECVQQITEEDSFIIVTDSFIRQLDNEFQRVKTNSQGVFITQEKFDDTSTNKCYASDIEQKKDNEVVSEVLSLNYEVNQNNICTNIDDICGINTINFNSSMCTDLLIKQDINVINKLDESKLSPFKTTNTVEDGFLSIFDVPKDNTLVENYVNINNSVIGYPNSNTSTSISDNMIELNSLQTYEFDYSNSDQSIENHPISENNISCSLLPDQTEPNLVLNQCFHTEIKDEIKFTSDCLNSVNNHDSSLKNNSSSFSKDDYSKKNKNLYSNCYCKNFSSFNHNDNTILYSKINHFAFNNCAKKVRQKILHQKHLEANILKILITKERKHIIQSKEHIPIFNSTPTNIKYEKCIQSVENDHIKPNILTMLKDVYVDVEYLTEYSDHNTSDISFHKSPESEKINEDNKINFQAPEVKPIQNMCTPKDNNDSTSNNATKNKPINLKPCKENDVNLNINKIIDKPFTSNDVTKKKPVNFKPCDGSYVNFNKNKIVDNCSIYNSTTKNKPIDFNFKPHDGNNGNFDKNKIIDNTFMLNNTIKNKSTYLKSCNKNDVNLNISKIIDNASTSKSPTTKKPANIKLYDEMYVKFNEKDIIGSSLTSNCTTKKKSINLKPCDEKDFNLNISKIIDNASTSKSPTTKKPANIKLYDEMYVNFNKKDIIGSSLTSNCTTKKKSINLEPCDEKDFNLNINKIIDNASMSNSTTKKKSINFKPRDENDILIDYETNNSIKKNDFDCDTVYKSHVVNANFDTISKDKEDCLKYGIIDTKSNLKTEKHTGFEIKPFDIHQPNDTNLIINKNNNFNEEFKMSKVKSSDIESENIFSFKLTSKDENKTVPALIGSEKKTNMLKIFEPPQYKNLVYTSSNADQICSMLPDISEPPVKNVFNLPIDDISFSFNNSSSDDDCDDDNRLLIEDAEVNILKDVKGSNPNLPENKISISDNFHENLCVLKEENNSLDDCMSIQMCNEFYKTKTLNKSIVKKNESLPKNIQDILKEMYVDELFVTTCQHMVELNNDGQLKNDVFLPIDGCKNVTSEKFVRDIINENVDKKTYSEFNQTIPTNVETLSRPEINYTNKKTNKPSNFTTDVKKSLSQHKTNDVKTIYPELIQSISTKKETILNTEINDCNQEKKLSTPTSKTQNSDSLQKPKNIKSNMKIRIHLREFIKSNIPLNDIFESKEFRNFKFFGEEEIASSISVFIFEQTIEPPIITGLSVYRENYDQLKNEEKNRILTSTNLNIICPKIMKLTSISLALVKMLRSDTLIEIILNVIRKNVLKKQMNIDHTIDSQLIKQILYFVDICVRLRLLKTLQIFIFDSMVFLPNKYCCIIFISLLLWKNCLPRSINNKEDPVIIIVMSYLIAKKKLYSEETVGCDIFQRELINLLSCHFNYTFSIDMPTNFIQHIHKPDFFVSVIMFLKCCNPKDLAEFMVNCLFPIIDNYLNTQQNEMYAIQTMESIIMAVKPFKIACNSTVATYLKKCKDPINSGKTNGKEHIYNSIYNSYKILQNKFIEYLNDSRPRSQYFEESLMSIILMLGSVDYLDSCMSLMQWKPKFELSPILSKKIFLFKSIIGDSVWDTLCAIDDIKTLKCLVNSCVLNKDVHNTIIRIHALR